MKRAAGQIRKVRRNKGGDKDSNDDVSHQHELVQQPVRRKPTPEEAALTAKNYRLAKELSDLRVRHREECKANTRMTMENMNLASRWREAIGHVSMLKKELALHQRRAAEALAQQKSQAQLHRAMTPTQPSEPAIHNQHVTPSKIPAASFVDQSPCPPENNNNSLQDVAAEMDRMDRILAAHQAQSGGSQAPPPPPPPQPKGPTTPPPMGTPSDRSRGSSGARSFTDSDGEEKKTQSMDQAVTPSPEKLIDLDEDDVDDDEEDDEFETQEGRPKEDFFSMFAESNQIDLDDLEVDDPPLELSPASVTPSESPPPSPPQQHDSSLRNRYAEAQNDSVQEEIAEKVGGPPLFPMTASPKLMVRGKVYNEQFPPDITSEVTRHPRSAERRTSAEFNDIAEEENPASASNVTARKRPPPPLLSGIDAFEASFATQFPDSFSPTEDNQSTGSAEPNTEEYNPFFPSLTKQGDESENNPQASSPSLQPSSSAEFDSARIASSTQSSNERRGLADNSPSPVLNGKPRSAALDPFYSSSYNRENSDVPNANVNRNIRSGIAPNANDSPSNVGGVPKRYSNYANNGQYPSDSPPQSKILRSNGERYETPPHGERSPELPTSDGPKRPEKAGAAAARVRYEKALQPRGFSGNSRRFPRRAEGEIERGASPVAASGPLPNANGPLSVNANGDAGKAESNDLQANRTMLAMAQARVKERTAAYSGRVSIPAPENGTTKSYTVIREKQWGLRPSPTESVASKPWDEIGDIPLGGASLGQKQSNPQATVNVNGSNANATGRTNGTNLYVTSSNSPLNNGSSPTTYTRPRDRPWDRSNQQQEAPSRTSHTAAIRAANYLVQQHQESTNDNGDSPTSRFIAAGKSRRRVKQPISYTEPSLNSKLRQGDVYFPKVEQNEGSELRAHSSTIVHL